MIYSYKYIILIGVYHNIAYWNRLLTKSKRSIAMLHQIGRKLRVQIHRFSGELCAKLGSVSTRFVEEMIYGMCASGSVLLTEVARRLEEPIALHATHKRLSANLDGRKLEKAISESALIQGAKRIQSDTLLIVDPSDITKKYAKKI